jgi:hypothetical protein
VNAAPPLFVEQRVAELQYFLYAGRVDSELWQVLDHWSVRVPDAEIELALIGASHVLRLRSADEELTEVLACSPPPTGRVPLAAERGPDPWSAGVACGRVGLRTQGRTRRFADAGQLLTAQRRIAAARPQLMRLFPRAALPSPPLTAIRFWLSERGDATVETHHTYPRDLSLVVTRTRIAPLANRKERP